MHLGVESALGCGICVWGWDLHLGVRSLFLAYGFSWLSFFTFSLLLEKSGVMSYILLSSFLG